MSVSTYTLTQSITTSAPSTTAQWQTIGHTIDHHDQYPQAGRTLPIGTWLLSLGDHLYRLADGRLVCLSEPIEAIATPLTDTQARQALLAYRTLREKAREQYGLSFDEACHRLPPFKLI